MIREVKATVKALTKAQREALKILSTAEGPIGTSKTTRRGFNHHTTYINGMTARAIDQEEERIGREISKENQARQTWEERQHQALTNQWERAARERKVAKLVEHIDHAASAAGLDDRAIVAMFDIFGVDCVDWEEIAKEAGTRRPSEKTVAAVVAVYEGRVSR